MICSSKKEREAMERFFALEFECNEHNTNEIEQMDKSHLTKGIVIRMNASIKRWTKESILVSRWIAREKKSYCYGYHKDTRTWLV